MSDIHGPILRIEHISKRFAVSGHEVLALQDVSLDIAAGRVPRHCRGIRFRQIDAGQHHPRRLPAE